MRNRVVYIPCELKARDLESRLLIAARVLKRGTPVLFGQMWSMIGNFRNMPKGCVIYCTANKIQAKTMANAKMNDFVVLGFDQEALPFSGAGFLDNVDPMAAANCDRFLVATTAHRDALHAAYPDLPIDVVGSPRVDILRSLKPPAPMTEPYVLFNSSFALTNSIWGSTEKAMSILRKGGGVSEQVMQERLDFEIASKTETLGLLEWMAENLPWRVVVRPHPAENADSWHAFTKDRMTVVAGQSPIPWIAHAKLMVHSNSTTGLEAAFLGTPCLNVSPTGFDDFVDQYVLRQINATVRTAQTGAEAIAAWAKTGKGLTSTLALETYPLDSADLIAEIAHNYVAEFPIARKYHLDPIQRTDPQKAKFTVSLEEVVNCYNSVNSAGGELKVMQVQDSLFYFAV
jgi:surface carbohydrate biosynthesis protein